MKKQGFLVAAAFILSAFCSISPYKAIAAGASFVVTFIVSKEEETLEDMVDESLKEQSPTTAQG